MPVKSGLGNLVPKFSFKLVYTNCKYLLFPKDKLISKRAINKNTSIQKINE